MLVSSMIDVETFSKCSLNLIILLGITTCFHCVTSFYITEKSLTKYNI